MQQNHFNHNKIKYINERIHLYQKEAITQLILDVIILGLLWALFILVRIEMWFSIIITALYCFGALVLHYKVWIYAIQDKRKDRIITETVQITKMDVEFSWAGDRFGHSRVRWFYPKEMDVDRCKIYVMNHQGKIIKLRSVMSHKRYFMLASLDDQFKIKSLLMTYLEKSKILLYVELADLSHHDLNEKAWKELEKTIRVINSSV